jgi:hypothetical protein
MAEKKYRIIKKWCMRGGVEKYRYMIQKNSVWFPKSWRTLGYNYANYHSEWTFNTKEEAQQAIKNLKNYNSLFVPKEIKHPTTIIGEY